MPSKEGLILLIPPKCIPYQHRQKHKAEPVKLLAAGLKLIIPVIVVVPGIAAYVMVNDPAIMAKLGDVALKNLPSILKALRFE